MSESSGNEKTEDSKKPISWRTNLYVLWCAQFTASLGFSVVSPILPLYVQNLGVTGDAQTRIWSGLVFSAHAVTMTAMAPVWGVLGDRHGRKLMVERAMFAGSVIMALCALAQNVQQLALLKALQGVFTGITTASTALVASTVPRRQAGSALGSLQMGYYLGNSLGPLLGGLVADALGFRAGFVVTSALLMMAAVAVLILVREPERAVGSEQVEGSTDTRTQGTLRTRAARTLSPVLGSTLIMSLIGIRFLMRLGTRMQVPMLPLFVEAITPPGGRVATIAGLITGFSALAGAIGGRQLGKLSDRVGYRSILIACAAASVLCYLPQSLVQRPIWLVFLQAGAGLAMGGIVASISAALANLTPVGREGIVYGIDGSVVGVANALAPIAGSVIAAYMGLRAPFVAAALAFALGALLTFQLLPRTRSRADRSSCPAGRVP